MQDCELYQQIFGLKSPWSVSKVALDVETQQVDVYIEHLPGTLSGVFTIVGVLRPHSRASMAASGQVPVQDDPAREDSSSRL